MTAETKWTPGPWHWDSDPVKNDPHNRVRYRVTALGKTITQVYYSSYEGGPTNAEADARLIAAAPEMAEALEQCLGNLKALGAENGWGSEAARAALARARGEQL